MTGSPAARNTLRILRFLAAQPDPVPAERIASSLGLPRASTYRLLSAMTAEGFVVHLEEDRVFGLGVGAFEAGTGYVRQAPLRRLAHGPMTRLVDRVEESAHLAVLHGRDVLYLIEERAPGRPSLVTDVGVRLPAHLTASGRAMLAALPRVQVRALFPDRDAFATHRGTGPATPAALRSLLAETRQRGYAVEDDEVTPGLASVAVPVLDHNRHPVASVAVTFAHESVLARRRAELSTEVAETAHDISRRLTGR
ncbi:MAG: helix-turn-helix domain-containing protein [Propionibacteriales bacterium]|nr:helix-turn-helix domain-containing protein [Propionibacteriales bacterium]